MSFRSELPFRDTYPTLTCRDTSNHLTFNKQWFDDFPLSVCQAACIHHLFLILAPSKKIPNGFYKQKPDDPRVWMELSIEERKILQQALGIDSIESRD